MNFPRARQALNDFYSYAQGKLPVTSFNEMVEHYRTHVYADGGFMKHDDFLEDLDGALKYSKPADTKAAMKKLADATPKGKLPSTQAFFKALANQAEKLTASEFTGAVKEGLKDTVKVAAVGLTAGVGLYVAIGLGALLIPYFLNKAK